MPHSRIRECGICAGIPPRGTPWLHHLVSCLFASARLCGTAIAAAPPGFAARDLAFPTDDDPSKLACVKLAYGTSVQLEERLA